MTSETPVTAIIPSSTRMSDTFAYDVFLSHSSKDKTVVRELAHRLKSDGLRVWFDEWEIRPGDMINKKIEDGLEASRVLVLAMSQHAFASDWAALEGGTFRFRDPINRSRRFIPLRLDDADIPASLMLFAYVDWRDKTEEEFQRLLAACRSTSVAGRDPSENPAEKRVAQAKVFAKTKVIQTSCQVNSLAITPSGKHLLTGTTDKMVRLWDVDLGQPTAVFKGHTREVICVAMTPDRRLAVSGSYDETLRVWDLSANECIATLRGHTDSVRSVAVTACGTRAVSAAWDRSIRMWDLEARKQIHVLHGHTDAVICMAMTPEGDRAISGSLDKTIRVWNLTTGKLQTTFTGHTRAVNDVALAEDGRLAISGSWDKTMRIWDMEAGKCVSILHEDERQVSKLAITGNGRYAVSGEHYGPTLLVWDLVLKRVIAVVQGCLSELHAVKITPDGKRVVACHTNGSIWIWDLDRTDRDESL